MHPILVHIPTPWGAIPIYSYGVMLGTSLVVAWYFIMYFGRKKEGLDEELMANCFMVTALCAILCARLLYVFTNLDEFDDFSRWLDFRSGGLVAYGGFLGGFGASWAYMTWKKVPMTAWADLVAPTLGSGLFFTRIGCWLYGCDFGKPLGEHAPAFLVRLGTFPKWDLDSAPALAFDNAISGSPAFNHHLHEHLIGPDAVASLPVHPTQIYESLAGLVIFGVGYYVLQHRRFRGEGIIAVTLTYSVWRFILEYWRDDPERGAAFGFSTSQLVSMALFPIAIGAWIYLKKRAETEGEKPIPVSALAKPAPDEGDAPKKKKRRGKKG
jgi:phosphatidylglycerol:prolipoprotein diacylglycerol transferase